MAGESAPGDRDPRRGGPPWGWRHAPPWAGSRGEGDAAGAARRWPWPSTLLLTVFVLAGSRFAAHGQGMREPLDPVAGALLAGGGLLLLWRHRAPRLVALGTAAVALVYLGAGYPYGPVFLPVALGCFSALAAGYRAVAWPAVGLVWAGHLLVAHWLYAYLPPSGDGPASWQGEAGVAAWALAVVAVFEVVRVRREQWARDRAERAWAAQRRADEERLRIARELHDVLAHSISVINVQAGVGLALLDSDPEQARTALTTIKGASKEALGEVRQVLDTLRAPGAAPRTPAPGLDRLPELVDQAASAGLTVYVDARTADTHGDFEDGEGGVHHGDDARPVGDAHPHSDARRHADAQPWSANVERGVAGPRGEADAALAQVPAPAPAPAPGPPPAAAPGAPPRSGPGCDAAPVAAPAVRLPSAAPPPANPAQPPARPWSTPPSAAGRHRATGRHRAGGRRCRRAWTSRPSASSRRR